MFVSLARTRARKLVADKEGTTTAVFPSVNYRVGNIVSMLVLVAFFLRPLTLAELSSGFQ